MKQTVEEAAREYIDIPPVKAAIKCGDMEDLESHIKIAFKSGAQWRESQIPEHISTVQDCEMAVEDTKNRSSAFIKRMLKGLLSDRVIEEIIENYNNYIDFKPL